METPIKMEPGEGPEHYVRKYLQDSDYKVWFHRTHPDITIFQGLGITESEFEDIARRLASGGEPQVPDTAGRDAARAVFESEPASFERRTFDEFVDERTLTSRDLFGKKEMKIKVLEVSDEQQPSKIRWKFGDRVKVDKIIVTIKHLDTMQVEEGEFDIAAIEKEIAEKRHYSSTNRWVPASDIKNGYVISSKHTALISDAVALDYIVF